MKIVAVSRKHSDQDGVALITEPALDSKLFEEFQRRASLMGSTGVATRFSAGHLVVQGDEFTPELRATIERLLTEAQDVMSGVAAHREAKEARRQARQKAAERELGLQSAAAGLGLPLV